MRYKYPIVKWLAICGVLSSNLMWSDASFAQDCIDLGNDSDWKALSQHLNDLIKSEDYEAAKKVGIKLLKKCPSVPSTNYIMGKVYQKLGDYKSAHTHFSIATDNTEQFSVDKTVLKDMWYARYESEYPDAYALRNGSVVTMQTSELHTKKEMDKAKLIEEMDHLKAFMWTGVGVGIAGVLAAIGGGVWLGTIDPDDYAINLDAFAAVNSNQTIDINRDHLMTHYVSAYILMGVGITAAVTGAIIAGFNGHLYTQAKTINKLQQTVDTSVSLSYNQITFNMTF